MVEPGLGRVAVVDGLDAVAVRVEEEAAVVVGQVLGPQAGLAVGAVAGLDARAVERVHVRLRSAAKAMCARRVTGFSSSAARSRSRPIR